MYFSNLDLSGHLLRVGLQAYLLSWALVNVSAQYSDYGGEGPLTSSENGLGSATSGVHGDSSRGSLLPLQFADSKLPWDHDINHVILEKCMQLQRLAVKKRNFGLEIPDIIMNRVQGGGDGNSNLKELRMRMVANGKRK